MLQLLKTLIVNFCCCGEGMEMTDRMEFLTPASYTFLLPKLDSSELSEIPACKYLQPSQSTLSQ